MTHGHIESLASLFIENCSMLQLIRRLMGKTGNTRPRPCHPGAPGSGGHSLLGKGAWGHLGVGAAERMLG